MSVITRSASRPAVPVRRLTVNDVCAALFASGLQRSDVATSDAVAEAVSRAVRQSGVRGCAGLMAQEFGDHSEAAIDRMRWIRPLAAVMPARRSRPATGSSQSGGAESGPGTVNGPLTITGTIGTVPPPGTDRA